MAIPRVSSSNNISNSNSTITSSSNTIQPEEVRSLPCNMIVSWGTKAHILRAKG
jgi:hypothetical protein